MSAEERDVPLDPPTSSVGDDSDHATDQHFVENVTMTTNLPSLSIVNVDAALLNVIGSAVKHQRLRSVSSEGEAGDEVPALGTSQKVKGVRFPKEERSSPSTSTSRSPSRSRSPGGTKGKRRQSYYADDLGIAQFSKQAAAEKQKSSSKRSLFGSTLVASKLNALAIKKIKERQDREAKRDKRQIEMQISRQQEVDKEIRSQVVERRSRTASISNSSGMISRLLALVRPSSDNVLKKESVPVSTLHQHDEEDDHSSEMEPLNPKGKGKDYSSLSGSETKKAVRKGGFPPSDDEEEEFEPRGRSRDIRPRGGFAFPSSDDFEEAPRSSGLKGFKMPADFERGGPSLGRSSGLTGYKPPQSISGGGFSGSLGSNNNNNDDDGNDDTLGVFGKNKGKSDSFFSKDFETASAGLRKRVEESKLSKPSVSPNPPVSPPRRETSGSNRTKPSLVGTDMGDLVRRISMQPPHFSDPVHDEEGGYGDVMRLRQLARPLHGKTLFKKVAHEQILQRMTKRKRDEFTFKLMRINTLDAMDLQDDLTEANLRKIFESYSPDLHGRITREDFKESLEFFTGGGESSDSEFQVLWKLVEARRAQLQHSSDDDECTIDFPLFCEIIRRCKLLLLYKMNADHSKCEKSDHVDCNVTFVKSSISGDTMPGGDPQRERSPTSRSSTIVPQEIMQKCIVVATYEEDDFEVSVPLSVTEYIEYPDTNMLVRYVKVANADSMTIRAMGIRHQLHPLVIQDILNNNQRRPRYDTNNRLLIAPMFRAPSKDEISPDGVEYDPYDLIYVQISIVMLTKSAFGDDEDQGMGLSRKLSRNYNNSIISSADLNMERPNAKKPFQLSIGEQSTVLVFQEGAADVLAPVMRRLSLVGSRIRHSDGSFLVYSILDELVDRVFPIIDSYSLRLEEIEFIVHNSPRDIGPNFNSQVYHIRKNLFLIRRSYRPMRDMLNRLAKDSAESLGPYIVDLEEHCAGILETLDSLLEMTKSILSDIGATQEEKQSQVLYFLTLVTTMFIPAQFLTGVYGMNFSYMPELEWDYSYLVFWFVVLTISIGVALYFKARMWL